MSRVEHRDECEDETSDGAGQTDASTSTTSIIQIDCSTAVYVSRKQQASSLLVLEQFHNQDLDTTAN